MKKKLLSAMLLIGALAVSRTTQAQGFIGNATGTGINAVTSAGTSYTVNVGIGVAAPASASGTTLEVGPPTGSSLGLRFDLLPSLTTPYVLYYDGTGTVTYGPAPSATTTVDFDCGTGTVTVNGVASAHKAWLLTGSTTTTTDYLGTFNDDDLRINTSNASCTADPLQRKMIIGSKINNGNVEIGWDGINALPIPSSSNNFNKFLVQNGAISTTPLAASLSALSTAVGASVTGNDIGIASYANQTADPLNVGVGSFSDNSSAQNTIGYVAVISNSASSNNGIYLNLSSSGSGVGNTGALTNISGNGTNVTNIGYQTQISGVGTSNNNTGLYQNIIGDNATNNTGVYTKVTANNAGINIGITANVSGDNDTSGNFGITATASGASNSIGIRGIALGSVKNGGVSGVAYGDYVDNTGNYGQAHGLNAKNYALAGIVDLSDSGHNTGSECIGVFATIDSGADGLKNYAVKGDLARLIPTAGIPYYAIYGSAANGGRGSGSHGSLTPSSSSIYSYAGYFEGDVFCSQTYYYSDPKLKENITDYHGALDNIRKLSVKNYTFRNDQFPKLNMPQGNQIGLLSTDLKAVFPNMVKGAMHPGDRKKADETVSFEAVNYTALIPVLIEAVKELDNKANKNPELDNKIKQQDDQIADLTKQLSDLKTMLSDICASGCASFQNNANSGIVLLSQSIPNPSSGVAVIQYSINVPFSNAVISISDKEGKLIKQYNLPQQQGVASVTFDSRSVTAGIYSYSLIIDSKVYDTKSLVTIKD